MIFIDNGTRNLTLDAYIVDFLVYKCILPQDKIYVFCSDN